MNSLMKLTEYYENGTESSETEEEESPEVKLPLPDCFKTSKNKGLPSQQVNEEGKIRNFPHEPGNWATYIYIPYTPEDSLDFSDYLSALQNFFKPLDLKLVEDFHISLTRTVILRHHWIQDFTNSVKSQLREIEPFTIHLNGLKAYVNEQHTRTFLSLRVQEGEDFLKSIVKNLCDSFSAYNLQGFYEDPSFHISLLWCPGDKFSEINKKINLMPLKLKNFYLDMDVSCCVCATGNKRFTFSFFQQFLPYSFF